MKKILLIVCLVASTTMWATNPTKIVRVYNQPEGGYLILDSNDELVGFAEKGLLTTESDNYKHIADLSGGEVQIMDHSLPMEIATKYAIKDTIGPWLGDIAYNQSAPYYNHCPIDPTTTKRCVTGCVATAMAMVMAYYQWPKTCLDQDVTYTSKREIKDDKGEVVKTIQIDNIHYDYRGHQFDWANMLPKYAGVSATDKQKDAVADLMFACGVACRMSYSSDESGSSADKALNAFIEYFNYNPEMKEELKEVDLKGTAFINALLDEFDAKRPVFATATTTEPGLDGGHAFVIDGYGLLDGDTKRQAPYFHFNWGWGGKDQKGEDNLWYMLSGIYDLSPYLNNLSIIRYLTPNNPTPVEEVEADNVVRDNKIYDMMGREVSETIPGNLYIRNGEKFMAR